MACEIAKQGLTICPGSMVNGDCLIYSQQGVESFERRGLCPFKDVRTVKEVKVKQTRNPLKQSKLKSIGKGGE